MFKLALLARFGLSALLLAPLGCTPIANVGTDGSAPPHGPLSFMPSNVDLSGIDLTSVGDFVVDGDCSIDTDSNLASCGDGASVLAFKLARQGDGSTVAVYVAKSMTIPTGNSLSIAGSHALVFIALETITLAGSLNGNAHFDVPRAGGAPTQNTGFTKGNGPGGGGAATTLTAGGGGSYCGLGGIGGAESGTPAPSAAGYGTPSITPLVAGSSGGAGGGGSGGGGGAIQLVAGMSITITSSGVVHVGGGGGGFGGISGQEANGGGSGGSILLESRAVTIAGTLAANGGGGGAGSASGVNAGMDATPNASPALGGDAATGPSAGGNGGAAASVNGTGGAFTVTAPLTSAAGGGGGGAGRIRINTSSGQATLSGTVSPAASTPCTTQGTVH